MVLHYYPTIFDKPDLDSAKQIILTNEGPGAGTEARWAIETPYVLDLITRSIALKPDMVVLDYGCGVGRIAKAMIQATGCSVIGLDISTDMLRLAVDYVGSDRFIPVTPAQFDTLCRAGLRVDVAISIWVLQHCFAPSDDIARIRGSLAAGADSFVLNMPKRAIPAVDVAGGAGVFTWASDGIDVASLLRDAFAVPAEGVPDVARTPNMADAGAFWMHLRSRPGEATGGPTLPEAYSPPS
jgi:SAM-dependent methyltransferase